MFDIIAFSFHLQFNLTMSCSRTHKDMKIRVGLGTAKTILQVTIKGTRRRGRQRKRLEDNTKTGHDWS